jgi:hypothetical protein
LLRLKDRNEVRRVIGLTQIFRIEAVLKRPAAKAERGGGSRPFGSPPPPDVSHIPFSVPDNPNFAHTPGIPAPLNSLIRSEGFHTPPNRRFDFRAGLLICGCDENVFFSEHVLHACFLSVFKLWFSYNSYN